MIFKLEQPLKIPDELTIQGFEYFGGRTIQGLEYFGGRDDETCINNICKRIKMIDSRIECTTGFENCEFLTIISSPNLEFIFFEQLS